MAEEIKDNIQIPAQCLFTCYHHALSLANICYIHSCSALKHSLHLTLFNISPQSLCVHLPDSQTHMLFLLLQTLPLPITRISIKLFHLVHLPTASHTGSSLKFIHASFFIFLLPVQTSTVTYLLYLLYHSRFIKLGLFSLLWCCSTKISLSAALNFTFCITLTHITIP